MLQELKIGLVVLVVFLSLDLPMILFINKKMYQSQLKKINRSKKVSKRKMILSAAITYLLLALGIYYFGVKQNSVTNGAVFGLIVYGVYNFTNLATIKKYDSRVSVVDTAWGTILCALVTFIALEINKNYLSVGNKTSPMSPSVETTTDVPSPSK